MMIDDFYYNLGDSIWAQLSSMVHICVYIGNIFIWYDNVFRSTWSARNTTIGMKILEPKLIKQQYMYIYIYIFIYMYMFIICIIQHDY